MASRARQSTASGPAELEAAMADFVAFLRSPGGLPGLDDIRLAGAACALLRAERAAPDAEVTRRMQAVFGALRRPDVYAIVKSVLEGPQP